LSEPNEPTPAGGSAQPAPVQGWGPGYAQPLGYGPQQAAPQPQPQYGQGQYGQGQYGQPQYGQPQYGQPQYGQGQYGQPQYGQGQYGHPQYGQPQYGQGQYGQPQYGMPAGYVPPPVQRGIVPLRPLSLGEIYDGAFRSVRANPRVMFGFSMMVVSGACVVGGLLWYLLIPTISGWMGSLLAYDPQYDPYGTMDMTASLMGIYALMPFLGLASTVLNGVLTVSVSRSVIGQKVTVGELWGRHWKRVGQLVVVTLVQGLAYLLAWVLFIMLVAWVGSATGAAAAFLGIVGGLGLFVATVWVYIRLLFVPPVLMLEDTRLWASLGRSWRLTRGSFWRILGIHLLAQIIAYVASQILSTPLGFAAAFLAPNMASGGYVALVTAGMALSFALTAVFIAAVVALQYIDVRIRREGLDVQLTKAAETAAQQTGAL